LAYDLLASGIDTVIIRFPWTAPIEEFVDHTPNPWPRELVKQCKVSSKYPNGGPAEVTPMLKSVFIVKKESRLNEKCLAKIGHTSEWPSFLFF